jgi:hypothetical protein
MNSLIFLVVVLCVYYAVYKYKPEYIEEKYHYYLGGSVAVYLFIIYMFSYQTEFMYKLFKNIYDTSRQPLYNFNAQDSNAQLYNSLNPNADIKSVLCQKQGNRCARCQNYIMMQDLDYYKLKYLVPLENGGQNNVNNLGVVCPNCLF